MVLGNSIFYLRGTTGLPTGRALTPACATVGMLVSRLCKDVYTVVSLDL